MENKSEKGFAMPMVVAIVIVLVVIVGGAYYYVQNQSSNDTSMQKDENDAMVNETPEMMQENNTDTMTNKEPETMMKAGSYEAYAPEKIALASDSHDVVLFFRASWCPTCKTIDSDIRANLGNIPSTLTILDVNYDNSSVLKQKYGVTYQHTFVQVDKDGNLIKKWSGSPTLSALVSEVK